LFIKDYFDRPRRDGASKSTPLTESTFLN